MAKKTVAEVLADAKKRRDAIQKKALKVTEAIPRVGKIPVLGAADLIAGGLTDLQNAVMDHVLDQAFADFEGLEIGGPTITRAPRTIDPNNPITRFLQDRLEFSPPERTRKPKVRSDKQLVNDQIQSIALKEINIRARKKDGSFKKGWNQKRIMRLAQKECTKERERLGLCKRKSTRKGQRRKTARRAYKR